MADLATLPQLELSWRTLTNDEKPRAEYKLGQASRYVRHHFPDVDTRITSGQLSAEAVSDVVVAMVERAFPVRNGIQSESEAKGPFTITRRYFAPESGMYLTDEERSIFLSGPTARLDVEAFSVRPSFAADLP